MNLQYFGGRGSTGGSNAGSLSVIVSRNSEGQELRIPRKTYEDRLKRAEDYKQGLLNMANDRRSSYRLNPDDLRRADEEIKRLKKILQTGRD